MAGQVPVKVTIDGSAIQHYPRLTEELRASLRTTIPVVTKELAARVREKLMPGALFKTTTRLLPAVTVKMIENANEIYGTVYIDPGKFPNVVAHSLESGSRAHDIEAKNGKALFFFWEKLGQNAAFKKVHHPGFAGRSYMQSSLDDMKDELVEMTKDGVLKPLHP